MPLELFVRAAAATTHVIETRKLRLERMGARAGPCSLLSVNHRTKP